MLPAAQTVGPVQPVPPHCAHFAAVPPELPAAAVVVVEAALVVVVSVEAGFVVVLEEAAPDAVPTTLGPVGVSSIASLARTHPVLAVMAAGQAICLNVTAGLSAFWNQSNRQ